MNAGNAGRPLDIGCADFLASHSEYMDGQLSPTLADRFREHAAGCASCARYDRIVRRGAELVQELPDVPPSMDFEHRLNHRLFHVMDAESLDQPRAASAAVALGLAAVISLIAWSPLLIERAGRLDAARDAARADAGVATTAPAATTPTVATPTAPARRVSGRPAVVEFDAPLSVVPWYPVATPPVHQPADIFAMFPGPHSPLVVTPPSHRSVRSVSSYGTID